MPSADRGHGPWCAHQVDSGSDIKSAIQWSTPTSVIKIVIPSRSSFPQPQQHQGKGTPPSHSNLPTIRNKLWLMQWLAWYVQGQWYKWLTKQLHTQICSTLVGVLLFLLEKRQRYHVSFSRKHKACTCKETNANNDENSNSSLSSCTHPCNKNYHDLEKNI